MRTSPRMRAGGNRLDVPPRCQPHIGDPMTPLWITEGQKKGDALASIGVERVIALGGVWSWRGRNADGGLTALGDWDDVAIKGSFVVSCFDSDVMEKAQVRQALDRKTAFLRARGSNTVYWVFLPPRADGSKCGIDDFIQDRGITTAKELQEALEDVMRDSAEVQQEDPLLAKPTTDLGNGERFAEYLGDRARWCEEKQVWYWWDGRRWNSRPSLEIERMAKEMVRAMQVVAESLPDSIPAKDALVTHSWKLEGGTKFREMIDQAKAELEVSYELFDRDPWLLNAANGTIDLRTGELKEHDPRDFITKMTRVAYDPEAVYQDWEDFLVDSTEGQEGLLPFLQMAAGYSATGQTSEEKLFMIIGKSRAGKSTFIDGMNTALGEYAITSDFETFLASPPRGSGGPTEGLAKLAGGRFVSSSEVDEGRKLALAAVKQLTGGDIISARFMYKGLFEFRPQFSLWLVANNEPVVPQDEVAMWERVMKIPFLNVCPPERRDHTLKSRLRDPEDGGPGVLAWIVRGCLAWQRAGKLVAPPSVVMSTNEYRDRMDPLGDFIEEKCMVGDGYRVSVSDMTASYVKWARDSGEKIVLARKKFTEVMEQRGYRKVRPNGSEGWKWEGITLLSQLGPAEVGIGSFRSAAD